MSRDPTKRIPVRVNLPGRYSLPADLEFAGLFLPKGEGILRIRFHRGADKSLEIPLSEASLSGLIRALSVFRLVLPADLPDDIQHQHQLGLVPTD